MGATLGLWDHIQLPLPNTSIRTLRSLIILFGSRLEGCRFNQLDELDGFAHEVSEIAQNDRVHAVLSWTGILILQNAVITRRPLWVTSEFDG